MLSQKMTIMTDSGKEIRGTISSRLPRVLAPEECKEPMEIKNMFMDIGASSREKAEEVDVEVDSMVTSYDGFKALMNDKYLTARAFDNRYGRALAVEVLKRLEDENIGINLYSGAAVRKETGLRDAKATMNTIKSDLAIAVDVGIAHDTPGMSGQTSDSKLGGSPVVIMMDTTSIVYQGLRKHIKDVAKKRNIKVQWSTTPGGGTDAESIYIADEDIPTVATGVTLRYIHSNISILSINDYENSVRLVTEIVRSLNDETCKNIM